MKTKRILIVALTGTPTTRLELICQSVDPDRVIVTSVWKSAGWKASSDAFIKSFNPVPMQRISVNDLNETIIANPTFTLYVDGAELAEQSPAIVPSVVVLTLASETANTVVLDWSDSSDDDGVESYDVTDSVGPTTVNVLAPLTTWTSGTLSAATHNFTVVAKDAAANVSAASNTITKVVS